MDVSYKWLKTLVDIPVSIEEYEKQMILAGFEVEGVRKLVRGIENVVVGKITKIEKHPDADKLQICQVDVAADEEVQIVTGADNVFEGAVIPVALVGAVLPDGTKIKKGKLRGAASNGMLCGGSELGFDKLGVKNAEVDGILILEGEYQLGQDIVSAVGLEDEIIEFSITANRSDCMSMNGIAMESAAVLNTAFHIDWQESVEAEGEDELKVIVEAPDLCPRYMAAVIDNIKIGPSPDWMQQRLMASGIRPINNMVDITNYVMTEYGQPMHAFDYDAVSDHTIVVRRAGQDKTITTLDGKQRKLSKDMLLIADPKKPIGLAGVMGGENSQITPETKKVVLESALFKGVSVRHTSKELGLLSDAAQKFIKGISPVTAYYAYYRALNLIRELGVGRVKNHFVDVVNTDLSEKTLTVSAQKINERTALTLEPGQMKELLERLQIKTAVAGDALSCTIPYFRLDIDQMADISEEVARMYGYHNIPSKPLTGVADGGLGERQTRLQALKKILMGKGFHEVVTYSFFSAKAFDKLELSEDDPRREVVRIKNPLGEDQSVMRTTMADSLLSVLSLNSRRDIDRLAIYELGRIYLPINGEKLPEERQRLALGMYGEGVDFFAIKGQVESILRYFGIREYDVQAQGSSFLHGGRRCRITTTEGAFLAEIGEVAAGVQNTYELNQRTYYADIDFDTLIENEDMVKVYQPIPRFPAVYRDLAVVVDKEATALDLMREIKKVKHVSDVKVFDVYQGEQVPQDKKSIAFSIVFRAGDRTLNEKETGKSFDLIVKNLKDGFGAELR